MRCLLASSTLTLEVWELGMYATRFERQRFDLLHSTEHHTLSRLATTSSKLFEYCRAEGNHRQCIVYFLGFTNAQSSQ